MLVQQQPLDCPFCTCLVVKTVVHGHTVTPAISATVNTADEDGFMPLHRVLYFSSRVLRVHGALFGVAQTTTALEAAHALIQTGADVNAKDPEGFTPLHFAFVYKPSSLKKIIQLLLSSGADPNAATTISGYTPLHFACKLTDDGTLAGLLIQAGADVNRANKDDAGCTPLHFSMHPDISTVLLEAGARVGVKNKYGKTPWDVTDDVRIKKVLQEASWKQSQRRAWISHCLGV